MRQRFRGRIVKIQRRDIGEDIDCVLVAGRWEDGVEKYVRQLWTDSLVADESA